MRKTLLIILLVLVVVLGGGGGWYWWTVWRFLESTDDAYVAGDITVVSPKIAGYIKQVRVANNQQVAAGQVLFVIDERDFAAKLAQAKAAVASEQATIATYDDRLRLQQALIDEARAEVNSAQADLTRTQQDYARYSKLVTSDFASRQRFEEAEASRRKAEAALVKARAGLVAQRDQLSVLRSERRQKEAELRQAQASEQLAQNNLDDTVIRAPISGVAGNRAGQLGQYVKPGTQLVSLVPLHHVYVTANFKETQLTRMRRGQPALVEVYAYPAHEIKGRIESFAPASGAEFSLLPPDNATGNFTKIVQRVPVRIALPAGGPLAGLLRPGLSVSVTIDTRQPGRAADKAGAPKKAKLAASDR